MRSPTTTFLLTAWASLAALAFLLLHVAWRNHRRLLPIKTPTPTAA
ncbi:hypothetical protein LZK73_34390 (plasmid) [Neorhizobium galegae]|nr:hypothetical protein LZK73_34390 [Neorhizobium galegae]